MIKLRYLFLPFIFISLTVNVYAQPADPQAKKLFFAAPITEVLYYGVSSPSFGYGIAAGTEDSVSIGLRALFAHTFEKELTTMEITIFMRFYIPKFETTEGLFVQLNTGAAVFSVNNMVSLPEKSGVFTIGVSGGWRFLLQNNFFIEPYLRFGYPYFGGAGVSAGIKF